LFGYIFPLISPEPETTLALQQLARTRRHVALVDLLGDVSLPGHTRMHPWQLFDAVISQAPGTHAARYLLQKGHRRVAYLSPFHRSTWSINRFAGMQRVFSAAGRNDSPALVAFNNPAQPHTVYLDSALRTSAYHALQPALRRWAGALPDHHRIQVEPLLMHELPRQHLPQAEFNRHLDTLFTYAHTRYPDVTAWVCANDEIARQAQRFCVRTGDRTRISILGFDDSLIALHHRITSYNFNTAALARRVLWSLLRPYSHAMPGYDQHTPVEGMFIERGSVREIT
jgi:DNA-binding LacI/PurR family transcriptional regulator